VDLVILNEDTIGYRQVLHDRIMGLATAGIEASMLDKPGGVFVRAAEQMVPDDRLLMQAVARIMISDRLGGFAEQLEQRARRRLPRTRVPEIPPLPTPPATAVADESHRDLLFFNGLGGFTADGREYRIVTGAGRATPAPWVNVLANARFGSVVTESGAAYTWSENAQAFRLTPWNNDPVGDLAGEAYYIKDEASGAFWSPMPLPRRDGGAYITRHGFGYSVFEHTASDIRSETWVYVDVLESVKYVVVKLSNQSTVARRLSVCGYVEWVLADTRSRSLAHLVTELDAESGAVVARNAFNADFEGRVAFYRVSDPNRSFTADRTEFIGRNGSLQAPLGLTRPRLSSRVGPGLDACAALNAPLELAPLEKREVVFVLGAAPSVAAARMLATRTGNSAFAGAALQAVHAQWNSILGAVQVQTPDAALNVMVNGWLPYQVLASRVWARSGFYQSGGAFGFRDQLQDVTALLHTRPDLAREQLLRCASRQFPEGDVQHWWHPPSGRGVRTHISDDYLWMPLVAARYLQHTGDDKIFDELVPFIEGPPVAPEADSHYDLPRRFDVTLSFYEHCVRAILHGLRYGVHGLPLMGGGDWNDGMNLVGHGGKGESVWLGFFLYEVLLRFAEVARHRGDQAFVTICETDAGTLRKNLHDHAWDGRWYRRAYFDNGEALGSAANSECQIDSIAQSWSVLSNAGDPARSRAAMEAADQRLVRRDAQLIQLLTPPFNNSAMNPGYIKGYVPGVRENGGQYTHAAVWMVMAFAQMGDAVRAWELFGMINPVHHASTAEEVAVYKVEPYVIAADVYAVAPHIGRGGWSWYTGSAAWMYRLILETLLGLQRHGETLRFTPCLPAAWRQFQLRYQFGRSTYLIQVREGALNEEGSAPIQLVDDGQRHEVHYVTARAVNGVHVSGGETAAQDARPGAVGP
jgi:cellobiose phosphorylase